MPPANPVIVAVLPPLLHTNVNGATPPGKVPVAVPFVNPKHVTPVVVTLAVKLVAG